MKTFQPKTSWFEWVIIFNHTRFFFSIFSLFSEIKKRIPGIQIKITQRLTRIILISFKGTKKKKFFEKKGFRDTIKTEYRFINSRIFRTF